jgi:hypothetical protein
MSSIRRKGRTRAAAKAPKHRVPKRPVNLTLDPEAVARGEQFGERHGASLSQVVNNFLRALPSGDLDADAEGLAPSVRRLYGAAAGGQTDREAYRKHLRGNYGARK